MLGTNLGDLRANDGGTVALVGVSCVVIVVLLLSDQEVDGFLQGGDNGLVVDVGHVGNHRLGRGSLFIRKRHDAGTVLRPDVVALAVELGRVVHREEDLKQRFVGNDGRVKLDFHHLGVAGAAAAHRLVGGVGVVAACVGGECGLNAVNLFVGAFNAPEASAADDHPFHGCPAMDVAFEGLIPALR